MADLFLCDGCKKEFPFSTLKPMGEIQDSPAKIRIHFFCPFCQASRGDNNPNYRYIEESPQIIRYIQSLTKR